MSVFRYVEPRDADDVADSRASDWAEQQQDRWEAARELADEHRAAWLEDMAEHGIDRWGYLGD